VESHTLLISSHFQPISCCTASYIKDSPFSSIFQLQVHRVEHRVIGSARCIQHVTIAANETCARSDAHAVLPLSTRYISYCRGDIPCARFSPNAEASFSDVREQSTWSPLERSALHTRIVGNHMWQSPRLIPTPLSLQLAFDYRRPRFAINATPSFVTQWPT